MRLLRQDRVAYEKWLWPDQVVQVQSGANWLCGSG